MKYNWQIIMQCIYFPSGIFRNIPEYSSIFNLTAGIGGIFLTVSRKLEFIHNFFLKSI